MKVVRLGVVTLLLVAGGAACGDDSKVGEGVKTGLTGPGGQRIGERTTTTAPAAAPSTTRAAPTTAKPVTTVAPHAALEISIKGQSPQFDPTVGSVRVGSIVRWINTDSQPRSVESDDGSFASPMLAPGATWDYKTRAAGTFNYHDGTRPFAVGQLQVS